MLGLVVLLVAMLPGCASTDSPVADRADSVTTTPVTVSPAQELEAYARENFGDAVRHVQVTSSEGYSEASVGIELTTSSFDEIVALRVLGHAARSVEPSSGVHVHVCTTNPDGTGHGVYYRWDMRASFLVRAETNTPRPTLNSKWEGHGALPTGSKAGMQLEDVRRLSGLTEPFDWD